LNSGPLRNGTITSPKSEAYVVPIRTKVPRRATEEWPDQATPVSGVKFTSQPPDVHQPNIQTGDHVEISLSALISDATPHMAVRDKILDAMHNILDAVHVQAESSALDVSALFSSSLGPALMDAFQNRYGSLLSVPEPAGVATSLASARGNTIGNASKKGNACGFDHVQSINLERIVRLTCIGRVYEGLHMDGPDIVHMDRGNFLLKKDVKPYWKVIAVDSQIVHNFTELRTAVDLRRRLGRSFKLSLEADEESARHHHEVQRKLFMKGLRSLKSSDEVDFFFLERERSSVLKDKDVVGNLLSQQRVHEMEVLLGVATAAEMESFLELVACLQADLSEEVRRIVSQRCVNLAMRNTDASTAMHHVRSKRCLETLLQHGPPGMSHKKNMHGQTGAQLATSRSPELADSFLQHDICSLLAIDLEGQCGAMYLEGTSLEALEHALPSWTDWAAALSMPSEDMHAALQAQASRVVALSKEVCAKEEMSRRCLIESLHFCCFGERSLWERGEHTASSCSRLKQVAAPVLALFDVLIEKPEVAETVKLLLQATKGPKHAKLDPRAPWREELELSMGVFEQKTLKMLDVEFDKVLAGADSHWLVTLEDRLLVPGFRLRMDSQAHGCPTWKHPEWVWEQDFEAALRELHDVGVFSSPTAMSTFTQQICHLGVGFRGLDRHETSFMRLHALLRREVCQVHVNQVRDWFAAWAGQHNCTFSARKVAKSIERVLVKASITVDEVVASCSRIPHRDLQTAGDYVTDINGVELVTPDVAGLEKIYKAILALKWDTHGAELLRVKNLFHKNAVVSETGYRDLKVWLLVNIEGLPLTVEVQLHLHAFHKFKKGMHVAYEYRRGSFDHDHVQPSCPEKSRLLLQLRDSTSCFESQEPNSIFSDSSGSLESVQGLEAATQKIRDAIRAITDESISTDDQMCHEVSKATALLATLDSNILARQQLDDAMAACSVEDVPASSSHQLLAVALEKAEECGFDCTKEKNRLKGLEDRWRQQTRFALCSESLEVLDSALDDAEALGLDADVVAGARTWREELVPLKASLSARLMNSFDNLAEMRQLISESADPNFINERGGSVLLLAVRTKRVQAVEVLLAAKANPNVSSKSGNSPLHAIAQLAGDAQTIDIVDQLLCANAGVNVENEAGWRPLHFAVMHKAEADMFDGVFNLLLGSRANINKRLPDSMDYQFPGAAALHLAIETRNNQAVKLLLRNRAKLTLRDGSGRTPLLLAVNSGDARLVEQLLTAQADVSVVGDSSSSVLHQAALLGRDDLIQMLVEAKADVNARNDMRQTPLAIAHGQENAAMNSVVQTLEQLGAQL
jgi:ankyrin repeat protein